MNLIHTASKLIVAGLLVLFVQQAARACSCGSSTPCEAAGYADAIFIGKVTKISSEPRQLPDFIDESKMRTDSVRVASLQVSKVYRGFSGTEIELWGQNTTCDFGFQENEVYLVFAQRDDDGKWGAFSCSHTALLARAQEDLEYLRRSQNQTGGSVMGTVTRAYFDRAREWHEKPLGRVAVNLVSADGKFRAFTDAKGAFVVRNLPAGKYQIFTEPATNISRETKYQGGPQSEWTIDVPANGCRTTWFSALPEGGIAGRVARADGVAAKHVSVYLIPADVAATDENTMDRDVDDEGRFRFDFVPRGRYYLGFNLNSRASVLSPYSAAYFPGVTHIEDATIIEVGVDQKLTGYDVSLTPALDLRKIEGVAVWPDGRPAPKLHIELLNQASGQQEGESAVTDSAGRFVLEGVNGQTYNLFTILWDENPPNGALTQAVKVDSTNQPVRFVIRRP